MIGSMRRLVSALAMILGLGGLALAQAPKPAAPPTPITMEELHRAGGVPRGWKFTLPPGDPKAGRAIFARLECVKCHETVCSYERPAAFKPACFVEITPGRVWQALQELLTMKNDEVQKVLARL